MNHFTQKYINNIGGAGGGPKRPDPPSPPILNPPKLGDLQAISSFEYVENIDLLSDGSIDGFVTQDGTYVDNERIFESVYLNDIPIKQTSTITNDSIIVNYAITGISGAFTNFFYQNGEFLEKSVDDVVQNLTGTFSGVRNVSGSYFAYDAILSYSIIDGKDNIAKDIYESLLEIPIQPDYINNQDRLPQLKVLNDYYRILKFGKFNYNSALEVSTYLLPDFPDKFKDEYPFVCLKLDIILSPSTQTFDILNQLVTFPLSYAFQISDYLYLDSDIYNQTYLPFEATELNKKRFLESRKKIDLTYPSQNGWTGSMYLFLYKKDGKILQNSVDAIIKNLKSLKIIKPKYKYNISNANCEIRDGNELQRPLSLFNNTYIDKNYGFKLFGPFGKKRPVLTLFEVELASNQFIVDNVVYRTAQNPVLRKLNTKFNPNSILGLTGVDSKIRDTSLSYITYAELERIAQKNSALYSDISVDRNAAAYNLGGVSLKSASINNGKLTVTVGSVVNLAVGPGLEKNSDDWNAVKKKAPSKYFNLQEEVTCEIDVNTGLFTQVGNNFDIDGRPATLVIRRFVYNRTSKEFEWIQFNTAPLTTNALNNGIKTNYVDWLMGRINKYGFEDFYINDKDFVKYGPNYCNSYIGRKSKTECDAARTSFYSMEYDLSSPGLRILKPYNYLPSISYLFYIAGALFQLVGQEGSDDARKAATGNNGALDYSSWNSDTLAYEEESARPFIHVVTNPNVEQVFITIGLRVLKDTAHRSDVVLLTNKNPVKGEKVDIGSAIPSLVRFKIECGYQDKNGNEIVDYNEYPRIYEIRGIADSPATIDIGREENNVVQNIQKYSRFIVGTKNIAQPIKLPPAEKNKLRFIRVSRITYESYSSLIKREISLEKVTEIVNYPFSYPLSSVCGLKLDSRSSSEIPSRSYDARFKKVFVPSNYFPLHGTGKDKRYLNLVEYNNATTEEKRIYVGNWDGTFKFAWTDNPAWIIFDLLINRRYGLGNFIDATQINYWELYKIARYCDAVDDDGIFVGVPADDGGYEPRYAFNGAIADKTNVFDMLKTIVSSFRGNLFYSNSEINFTNDRLKPIMSFFNNSNIKDGIFSYTNDRRDLQYNVIEVSFLDRTDLYKEKIEYVEDPDDIKNRGILRTSAQTFGVTSRAHAKRIGQHIIYSTINEDQNIQFVAGLETLLCRPGDLIAVNDELRSFKKHVGRVLNVDLGANSIYTNIGLKSSDFSASGITGEITVLIPTGKVSTSEFYDLSQSPSKLNIGELYKNDIPMAVTLKASATGINDYGSTFFIDTGCSGITLLKNIKLGAPCSITLSNTKQEIYKIASIKELNLNEYEVTATKFDTGKFAEIESNSNLNDFFNYFPASRTGLVSEGQSDLIQNQFIYQLNYPEITVFTYGDYDAQNDYVDISGVWNPVVGANCYDVELLTPKYKSIKQRTTGTNIVFYDQSEVGQFLLKVTARESGVYPNPISPTAISGFKVVSYTAPIRTNAVVKNFKISKNF